MDSAHACCWKSLAQGVHPNIALECVNSCLSDRGMSEKLTNKKEEGGGLVSEESDDTLVTDRRRGTPRKIAGLTVKRERSPILAIAQVLT